MPRFVPPSFPRAFYLANVMEVFERVAWYGFFTVSSVYMTTGVAAGGLGLSERERGLIQGLGPFFLYLLPVVTGALADRFGYRRMFLLAFLILAPGYALLGAARGFWPFFAAFLLVALGAAVFKPLVVATVARSSDADSRSLAFGLFYLMVNVGGFLGPLAAGWARGISWPAVFALSAGAILVNLALALLFLRDLPAGGSEAEAGGLSAGVAAALTRARTALGNGRFALAVGVPVVLLVAAGAGAAPFGAALAASAAWVVLQLLWDLAARRRPGPGWWRQPVRVSQPRFVIYLVILSGFWVVYQQLFITLPLYVRDFVDTSGLARAIAAVQPQLAAEVAHVDPAALARALADAAATPVADASLQHRLAELQVRPPAGEVAQGLVGLRAGGDPSALAARWAARYPQISPEYLLALDFLAIVVGQYAVSSLARARPIVPVVLVGLAVIAGAFAWAALSDRLGAGGIGAALVVLIFALGEMIASPKSQEYVAAIAPADGAAMYMGFYFVSMAVGFLVAGLLSGWAYGELALGRGRPDLMWLLFAAVALATLAALALFDRWRPPATARRAHTARGAP